MDPNEIPLTKLTGLRQAFEEFTQVSGRLQTSYQELQHRVVRLQDQLDEEARRNAELATRLAALLEALPGAVVMLDDEGVIREINSTATDFLGQPLRDMQWTIVCRRAFADSTGNEGDLALRDGRTVSLAQKSMDPGPGRVLLFTDVTEHRKVQELLARQRRLAAMGEMAAALAHQIRTPLSAALLYASNAARSDVPAGRKNDLLDKATRCLQDLEQLISDMLQFARGARFTDGYVGLAELFSVAEMAVRPTLKPGQEVRFEMPGDSLQVSGTREALAGVILNLVTNALQHSGADARVTVQASTHGVETDIVVRDNGPGVPPGDRDRIFDPFFTSRPDGTGLGLAVVRSVARAHQGDAFLDERGGTGATFVLRLPTFNDVNAVNSASESDDTAQSEEAAA
jgi:two-component system sensor histidine kinase FlrB